MSQPHGRKPNPHFELKCRVDGSMLRPLREFVSNVARTLGFGEKQVGEIEICVDEACANAIEHAYLGDFEREFSSCERDLCIELRFKDECVRHKTLDLIGDLALAGCDVAGQITAHRSGHRLNADLVRALLSEGEVVEPLRKSA